MTKQKVMPSELGNTVSGYHLDVTEYLRHFFRLAAEKFFSGHPNKKRRKPLNLQGLAP